MNETRKKKRSGRIQKRATAGIFVDRRVEYRGQKKKLPVILTLDISTTHTGKVRQRPGKNFCSKEEKGGRRVSFSRQAERGFQECRTRGGLFGINQKRGETFS